MDMGKSLEEIKKDYEEILKAILFASEAKKEKKNKRYNNQYHKYIHGLFLIFFYHCSAIYHLIDGIKLPFAPFIFRNYASIDVVARSAFETFLILNYIFIDPKSDEELELRFTSWLLSGWKEHEHHEIQIENHKEAFEEVKKGNQELRIKLQNMASFQSLERGERKQILHNFGKWRIPEICEDGKRHPPSYYDLARKAGLSKFHSNIVYKYLSKYTHPTAMSINQIHEAKTLDAFLKMIIPTLENVIIAMAIMLKLYIKIYSDASVVLDLNPELNSKVKEYEELGSYEM